MTEVTEHYAKTHLSRLLRAVEGGETVVILRGDRAIARLVPLAQAEAVERPRVGEPTTSGVTWTEDAFRPLDDRALEDWGL